MNRLNYFFRYWIRAGCRWHSPYHKIAFELATRANKDTIHRILDCGLITRAAALYQENPQLFTEAARGKLEYLRGNHDTAEKLLESALRSSISTERQRAAKLLTRLSPSRVIASAKNSGQTRLEQCLRMATQTRSCAHPDLQSPTGDEHLLIANNAASYPEKLQYLNAYWKEMGLSTVSGADTESNFDILALSPESATNSELSADKAAVSVVMTVYNGGKYLRSSMLSILRQMSVRSEIVIVDDASTDGTWDIILNLSRDYPGRVISRRLARNVGTYAAKNIALRLCTREYIAFQDADDWSHPARLISAITWLSLSGQHVAATSRYVRMDQEGRFFSPNIWPLRQWSPNTLVFRRAPTLEMIGQFDQIRFGADTDFFERIRAYFGDNRVLFQKQVMLIAMGLPSSLMHDPATGLDGNGHSMKRVTYRDVSAERILGMARDGSHPHLPEAN